MGLNERGGSAGGTAAEGETAPDYDPHDDSATELVVPDEIRARGRPSPPPQEPGAESDSASDERTDLMDQREMAAIAGTEADPVVEVGPIEGYEREDPADQTQESIAVDIQRPALPFDAPAAPPADDHPLQARVRAPAGGSIEDPQTASGLISVPAEDALPFAGGSGPQVGEPAEPEPSGPQSLWSRERQHSAVDPAELPSSLAPSALRSPTANEGESSSRPAWLIGALIAVAAGLVLALALTL